MIFANPGNNRNDPIRKVPIIIKGVQWLRTPKRTIVEIGKTELEISMPTIE